MAGAEKSLVDKEIAVTEVGLPAAAEGEPELTVEADGRLVVVAFDPGVETGWAASCFDRVTLLESGEASLMKILAAGKWEVGSIDRATTVLGKSWNGGALDPLVRRKALLSYEGWDSFTARAMVEVCRWWWGEVGVDPELDVFLIEQEDFILQTRDAARHTLSPVRINAAFDVLLEVDAGRGIRKVKFMPSDAKKTVTDERLKRWRMYDLGNGVTHQRDAIRHNILTIRKWASEPGFRARFDIV